MSERKIKPLTVEKMQEGGPFISIRFALDGATKRNVFDFAGNDEQLPEETILRIRLLKNVLICISNETIQNACEADVKIAIVEINRFLELESECVNVCEGQSGPDDFIVVNNEDVKTLQTAIANIYLEACMK